MQDAVYLNSQSSNSDLNSNKYTPQQEDVKDLKLKKVQIKDIEDMIDIDDLN
jgi:hypothetical protein